MMMMMMVIMVTMMTMMMMMMMMALMITVMMISQANAEAGPPESMPRGRDLAALRSLVWDGVPDSVREPAYLCVSGAMAKRERAGPGYYPKLAQQSQEPNLGLPGEESDWVGDGGKKMSCDETSHGD
jgi:hypothetical protein